MKTMTVADLIAELKTMPDEALITVNGNPILSAELMGGYYDGFDRDFLFPQKLGDVAKYVRNYGDKCRLHVFDLEDALLDFPDMEIQEGILSAGRMADVEKWREEGRAYKKWEKRSRATEKIEREANKKESK